MTAINKIPVSENWLYQNELALASVQQGLQESAEGKVNELGSFAQFLEE